MDEDLKQRLIGAVVITSLAAIFVPMLFNDPVDDSGKEISELKIPVPPEHLASPDVVLPQRVEDVIALPPPPALRESAIRASSDVDHKERWFLKVGSFSQQSNALTLQDAIRKQGFPVLITTVTTDNGQLYQVRVGPELSRDRAEEIKLRVDKFNNINSILISETD